MEPEDEEVEYDCLDIEEEAEETEEDTQRIEWERLKHRA